jgi:hypothetical protein
MLHDVQALITTSSGRLTVGYVASIGALELSAGLGARGGVVYMAGDSNRDDVTAGELYAPWGGPLVLLSAAGLIGSFRVSIELEGGYVTLPAEALLDVRVRPDEGVIDLLGSRLSGSVVASLSGFWGALGLGVGWLF